MCDPAEALFNRSRFLKEAKCKQPHKWYFALKITSFSDAFIAKTIRLHNTAVLHRSPPKYLNQENWCSTHFCWFKSPTWSRKSLSGEVWTPVQAPNMASNHGTIVEMSIFKGFKLWSLSELIVPFWRCRRVKQWEENNKILHCSPRWGNLWKKAAGLFIVLYTPVSYTHLTLPTIYSV